MAPIINEHDRAGKRKPGRAPTSCAECRRLKLRCDRKVPCGSCERRGCSVICPDGTLAAGKGNRLVLANTEELHARIERLCSRIRELEDALRALYLKSSNEEHPLLSRDLLQLKQPVTAQTSELSHSCATSSHPGPSQPGPSNTDAVKSIEKPEENFVDAFGTLKIGPCGETTFIGRTARSEYLINAPLMTFPPPTLSFPHLSPGIVKASVYAGDSSLIGDDIGQEVYELLPPLSEAVRLCELYLHHGQYMWSPISREELFDECLSMVYRAGSFANLTAYHPLSLLFIVFALATLVDPSQPSYSIVAQEYYIVSSLAFHFQPAMNHVTLYSVQAVLYQSLYLELSDWEFTGSGKAWVYIGFAVNLGHMIGLHLNNARWKLDKVTSERRSGVFWKLFVLDFWLSMHFGRPPNISLDYVDCPLPEDVEEIIGSDGEKQMGFHYWTWKYTQLMHTVMASAFGATIPHYATILELDRKIRDFPVPPYLRPLCEDPNITPELAFKRWNVLACKEWVLLNLHRSYFSQALQDEEEADILWRHKYGPSIMAGYRSAWRLIEAFKYYSEAGQSLIQRTGLIWSQVLSAAVAMCLFVCRSSRSCLAAPSVVMLDHVVSLFKKAAPTCAAAAHNLEMVEKLCQKAHETIDNTPPYSTTTNLTPAELDRLGGKTQLISQSSPEQSVFAPSPSSSSSSPAVPPLPTPAYTHTSSSASPHPPPDGRSYTTASETPDNIHPTVLQNMKDLRSTRPLNLYDMFVPFDFAPSVGATRMQPPPPPTEPPLVPGPGPHAMSTMVDGGIFGEGLFSPQIMDNFQMSEQAALAGADFGTTPAMVDSAWRSFMDELGL